MRHVGVQLNLVEGSSCAGGGARFSHVQGQAARLLQRAKAAIRAYGSSHSALMGRGKSLWDRWMGERGLRAYTSV